MSESEMTYVEQQEYTESKIVFQNTLNDTVNRFSDLNDRKQQKNSSNQREIIFLQKIFNYDRE